MVEALPGKRVLVVEDNPVLAFDIDAMLSDLGAEVVGPALDLDTGLQLAREQPIDGAVLDIDLGGRFVWPLAAELQHHSVPFVFVSAECGGELPRQFAAAACLAKPASGVAIASSIASAIAAH